MSNYNIAIFYDTSAACFKDFGLVLDDVIYDPSITNIETSAMGTPLPYESSLGFIRAGLSANAAGVVMDTIGTWIPTIRLCFDVKLDPITSPNTSFRVNFNSDVLQPLIGVPPNIVQEWNPDVFISDVAAGQIFDNNREPTLSASFVVEEYTLRLCSDGIDNDEDGLTDCDDTGGCSVGQPSINVTPPNCEGLPGRFRINGMGANITYSIDGGQSFTRDSLFTNLSSGNYDVVARRNDIEICQYESPVLLIEPECNESTDDICMDGIDNDGDGIIDCEDLDCIPLIDAVNATAPDNCPELDNGFLEIVTLLGSAEISIDSGRTYTSSLLFDNLSAGTYNVFIRNPVTGCTSDYVNNPVVIQVGLICEKFVENCADNLDNDNDGLIDCMDADCESSAFCLPLTSYYIPTAVLPKGQTNNRFGLFTSMDEPLFINRMIVFDRWGGIVYDIQNVTSDDPGHRWDGRAKGTYVPTGVYIYYVSYLDNGLERQISGDITIIN